jgi:hypothetical protein
MKAARSVGDRLATRTGCGHDIGNRQNGQVIVLLVKIDNLKGRRQGEEEARQMRIGHREPSGKRRRSGDPRFLPVWFLFLVTGDFQPP